MECYWRINGKIVAKKALVKAAENVLDDFGITIVDEDEEKISLFFDGRASYDMPEKLDEELSEYLDGGEYTAESDEGDRFVYTYGKDGQQTEKDTVEKEGKKKYCVGYKVEGRFYAYVEAKSVNEARELAKNEFYDADFGVLEDIGDCDTEQINVADEDGNILWER